MNLYLRFLLATLKLQKILIKIARKRLFNCRLKLQLCKMRNKISIAKLLSGTQKNLASLKFKRIKILCQLQKI
jgi:hypothetical protein